MPALLKALLKALPKAQPTGHNAMKASIVRISPAGARWALLVCLAIGLAACGARSSTPAPEAVFTSAAQTAQARSTELFAGTPTTDPASMVATIAAPSPTPGQASPTAPAPVVPPTESQVHQRAAGEAAERAAKRAALPKPKGKPRGRARPSPPPSPTPSLTLPCSSADGTTRSR